MILHSVIQGSTKWHELRKLYFTASDVGAMLGCDPYRTRKQLLHEKATGVKIERGSYFSTLANLGHALEERARVIMEEYLCETLYPVTVSEGNLLASLDGMTMDEREIWEHKSLNNAIRKCKCAEDLPEHYRAQMTQQIMITGCDYCNFTASSKSTDEWVQFIFFADKNMIERINVGWKIFNEEITALKTILGE